jgi:hypothetical protein
MDGIGRRSDSSTVILYRVPLDSGDGGHSEGPLRALPLIHFDPFFKKADPQGLFRIDCTRRAA